VYGSQKQTVHSHSSAVDAISHLEKEGMCHFWGCQSSVVVDRGGPLGYISVHFGWVVREVTCNGEGTAVIWSVGNNKHINKKSHSRRQEFSRQYLLHIVPCLCCVWRVGKWPEFVTGLLLLG
jgi:hypothetical protein